MNNEHRLAEALRDGVRMARERAPMAAENMDAEFRRIYGFAALDPTVHLVRGGEMRATDDPFRGPYPECRIGSFGWTYRKSSTPAEVTCFRDGCRAVD